MDSLKNMAIANCGQHWSWDSPMWCRGKIISDIDKEPTIDKMCITCPWWKGNKREDDYDTGI